MTVNHYVESSARSARLGNGRPAGGGYVPGETARAAQVAAIVAEARRKAAAAPGAVPRCRACGLPAAECEDTACKTRCPEHGAPLTRLVTAGLFVCPMRKWRCSYEIQIDN